MPGVMTEAVIPQLNPTVCRHPATLAEQPGERSLSKPHRTGGSTEKKKRAFNTDEKLGNLLPWDAEEVKYISGLEGDGIKSWLKKHMGTSG